MDYYVIPLKMLIVRKLPAVFATVHCRFDPNEGHIVVMPGCEIHLSHPPNYTSVAHVVSSRFPTKNPHFSLPCVLHAPQILIVLVIVVSKAVSAAASLLVGQPTARWRRKKDPGPPGGSIRRWANTLLVKT